MILTWWSILIILATILCICLIIVAFCKDSELLAAVSFLSLLIICLFGWIIVFNAAHAIKIIEPVIYNKIITDNNIILEFPDGTVEVLTDMKYLKENIEAIRIIEVNTYNDTTVSYGVVK